jgi:nitroreductase
MSLEHTISEAAALGADPGRLFRAVVEQAILAPSSHNTQPWLFRIYDDRLELYADRTRALPVNDPHDRELTISCAAALFNAQVAAAHAGGTLDVVVLPAGERSDLLARATLTADGAPAGEERLFTAIAGRRTHRGDFAIREVEPEVLAELAAAAHVEGARLEVLSGEARAAFVSLVGEGDRRQFADARWRRELASWMHPRRRGDGLAYRELAAPAVRFVVGHFDLGKTTASKDTSLAERSPALALLATPGDTVADWMAAGQALERTLLTATAAGLQASYLNQPLQVEELRPRVIELLEGDGVAQLALRLGHPPEVLPPTPRRPVDAVIEGPEP